ncbi:hypothetical protein LTR10_016626 [Elasticomyces elasticus]|uniref:Peptidase C14 caspase domain-containing protein n=1 Tax=Exophiala sideris TaxID=1016849 RepID=A0ABR0JKE0_9EURO|nr:hypothetical protein LTR10_016626 [Elasticomyces elasticus]KAK5035271.1 hypothetical protein LTS07_002707 [Exophiala sideris]KAK5039376.1 hypothetical protein LTR13_003633 [Exophiala sideris]KAK5066195.1 hypothetical protein LTR69_002713 [Exophiala sideris]KAK5186872.1 hypothetical protein LTR44_000878 [Eurotiomycetes sp. CCFEE 6388]
MAECSSNVNSPRPVQQERFLHTTQQDSSVRADEGLSDPVKLQGLFTREMQSAAQARTHEKVAVLLIQWEFEGEDFLDTRKEVEDLGTVFKDIYKFTVHQATLHTSPTNHPKKQLNYLLAKLINEEDVGNTLLIVYYAGHAMTKKGELWLSGGNPKQHLFEHESRILWEDVEPHLLAADADLLVIFDCCFAGALVYDARAGHSDRIFEYIGATVRDKTAVGPGETSFTNALIWALKQLSERVGGFTANTLVSKIRDAPYFCETTQEPIWSPRGKVESRYKLNILPLTAQEFIPENQRSDVQRREDGKTVFLDLQLCFDKCPGEGDILGLTSAMKNMILRGEVPLRQVRWRGLYDVDIKPDFREVAWKFVQQAKRRNEHKRTPSGGVLMSPATGDAQQLENDGHLAKTRKVNYLLGWLNLRFWHHYAVWTWGCTTRAFIQKCFWSEPKRHSGASQSCVS